MDILGNKKILLGVTGSIAAYKSPLLVRELIKRLAEVKVVMTTSASHFVSPLVLSNLSRNSVAIDMFDEKLQTEGAWHIHLAHWCDLMLIAPCTATTIAKIANGICDNSLVTLAIALPNETPLLISPAMDTDMLEHPSTQKNLETLKSYGAIIIPPDDGELSSGLAGPGRMPEINVLIDYIELAFKKNSSQPVASAIGSQTLTSNRSLTNLNVLITSGPTIEKIDDVRFISNFSSGKMGSALAVEAITTGAKVTLISGPTSLQTYKHENLITISIQSAEEMYKAALEHFKDADIAILAAAVADYSPEQIISGKLKKEKVGDKLMLKLKATEDILAALGKAKTKKQILVGFALESENEIENAKKKLRKKNCDIIVVNSLMVGQTPLSVQKETVFGSDYNSFTILFKDGSLRKYPRMTKAEAAKVILQTVIYLASGVAS